MGPRGSKYCEAIPFPGGPRDDVLEERQQRTRHCEIGNGDGIANKERLPLQDAFQHACAVKQCEQGM